MSKCYKCMATLPNTLVRFIIINGADRVLCDNCFNNYNPLEVIEEDNPLPKRCPICYDGHENMTFMAGDDTKGKWICKRCYLYRSEKFLKILFDQELSTEELSKVSEYRIRNLEYNLKEMREDRDFFRDRNDLHKLTDKELYERLEDVQHQIKFRIMNSDDKPDYKVCTHRGCLNEASDSCPVCIEHTGCPCKSHK